MRSACAEYAVRALKWAPRGAYRTAVGLARWSVDAEGRELRWSAVARDDAREYLHLSRQRNQRVHNRVPVVVILAGLFAVAVGLGVWLSPWSPLTRWAVVAAVVVLAASVAAARILRGVSSPAGIKVK